MAPLRAAATIVLGLVILSLLFLVSLAVGSRDLSLGEAWAGLVAQDPARPTVAFIIVWELRMPRTILALVAGASLAVAGVVMQALTRNPLAEPGILGVNAGAGLAVVASISLLGLSPCWG